MSNARRSQNKGAGTNHLLPRRGGGFIWLIHSHRHTIVQTFVKKKSLLWCFIELKHAINFRAAALSCATVSGALVKPEHGASLTVLETQLFLPHSHLMSRKSLCNFRLQIRFLCSAATDEGSCLFCVSLRFCVSSPPTSPPGGTLMWTSSHANQQQAALVLRLLQVVVSLTFIQIQECLGSTLTLVTRRWHILPSLGGFVPVLQFPPTV